MPARFALVRFGGALVGGMIFGTTVLTAPPVAAQCTDLCGKGMIEAVPPDLIVSADLIDPNSGIVEPRWRRRVD